MLGRPADLSRLNRLTLLVDRRKHDIVRGVVGDVLVVCRPQTPGFVVSFYKLHDIRLGNISWEPSGSRRYHEAIPMLANGELVSPLRLQHLAFKTGNYLHQFFVSHDRMLPNHAAESTTLRERISRMATRYMVHDVDASVAFYRDQLGVILEEQWGPAMAIMSFGDERLWLAGPISSAAKPMPDGRTPEPGGWNRIVLEVDNFDELVDKLRVGGATFRNEPISGPGGRQVLVEDPSGNCIELFSSH